MGDDWDTGAEPETEWQQDKFNKFDPLKSIVRPLFLPLPLPPLAAPCINSFFGHAGHLPQLHILLSSPRQSLATETFQRAQITPTNSTNKQKHTRTHMRNINRADPPRAARSSRPPRSQSSSRHPSKLNRLTIFRPSLHLSPSRRPLSPNRLLSCPSQRPQRRPRPFLPSNRQLFHQCQLSGSPSALPR